MASGRSSQRIDSQAGMQAGRPAGRQAHWLAGRFSHSPYVSASVYVYEYICRLVIGFKCDRIRCDKTRSLTTGLSGSDSQLRNKKLFIRKIADSRTWRSDERFDTTGISANDEYSVYVSAENQREAI